MNSSPRPSTQRRQIAAMIREAEERLAEYDFVEAADLYTIIADVVEERVGQGLAHETAAAGFRTLANRARVAAWYQRRFPEIHLAMTSVHALVRTRRQGGRLLWVGEPNVFVVDPGFISGGPTVHVRISRRGTIRKVNRHG